MEKLKKKILVVLEKKKTWETYVQGKKMIVEWERKNTKEYSG